MRKVHSANVSLYQSVLRIHAHEACSQERLVVTDTIQRRHHSIYVAMVGKHGHVGWCSEGFAYFFFRVSSRFHVAITVALGYRTVQNGAHLGCCELVGKGRIGLHTVLFREGRL